MGNSVHVQPLTYFVEQLPAGAVLEEDELPVAGLVGPRAVASHNIVVPVGQVIEPLLWWVTNKKSLVKVSSSSIFRLFFS